MQFSSETEGLETDIAGFFGTVFKDAEGAEEGALIHTLVSRLLQDTPKMDLHVFCAHEGGILIGGAIFSRLTYTDDPRDVFILSPMAVASDRQGQGIGQALLTRALAALRAARVDVAITYGDPAFYGKVGFSPLSETMAPAPLPLSQPHGWIGQSLMQGALTPLQGRCICVSALNDPTIW